MVTLSPVRGAGQGGRSSPCSGKKTELQTGGSVGLCHTGFMATVGLETKLLGCKAVLVTFNAAPGQTDPGRLTALLCAHSVALSRYIHLSEPSSSPPENDSPDSADRWEAKQENADEHRAQSPHSSVTGITIRTDVVVVGSRFLL